MEISKNGDPINCADVDTRGSCEAMPVSREDNNRKCNFVPFKYNPKTKVFSKEGDGQIMTTPSIAEPGTCSDTVQTTANRLKVMKARIKKLKNDIVALETRLASKEFENVANFESALGVADSDKTLYKTYKSLKLKKMFMSIEHTKLIKDVESLHADFRKQRIKRRAAIKLDSYCTANKLDKHSKVSDCMSNTICEAIDQRTGKITSSDNAADLIMGDSMCLSKVGENVTWSITNSGDNSHKLELRNVDTYEDEYFDWAWKSLWKGNSSDMKNGKNILSQIDTMR